MRKEKEKGMKAFVNGLASINDQDPLEATPTPSHLMRLKIDCPIHL